MTELYNLGLSDDTINSMIEINPSINDMDNDEILDKKNILKEFNCSDIEISNIIGSNPNLLSRTNEEIYRIVDCLKKYGFSELNILFDSNPDILNLDSFEVDNYINNKKISGMELDDIIDELDTKPYLFDEM